MFKRWICACLAVVLILLLMPVFPVTVKAAANFTVSQQLIDVVKQMEGFSAKPYWDYAQWTVGYGTRCPDDKLEEYKKNGISVAAAEALLTQAMNSYQTAVNDFANRHNLTLKQNQFDALVSFSYNCGTAWMYETTGYFNQAVRSGNTGSAFLYGICLFSTAGGEYILVNRRLSEANMYINGIYQASNSADFKVPDNFKYVFLDAGGATVPYNIFAYDANEGLPVPTDFKTVPVGVNAEGGLFAYAFQGWYTSSGSKLSTMDKSPANGSVIYARWADPAGKVADLPKGDKVNLQVTVIDNGINVRSGPATYYSKVGTANKDQVLQLTHVCRGGGYTWGKFDKGWIALSYTNYDQVLSQAAFPKNATVTGTDVNVRTGPSTDYQKVGTKTKGDRIVILKEQKGGSYMWGQMSDGNWICMDYVRYDASKVPSAVAIHVVKKPDKTTYYLNEAIDTTGGVVAILYDDGSVGGVPLATAMVSGYNGAKLGQQNLTVSHGGFTTNYTVNVVQRTYTVTFQDWDGTVLQSGDYTYGQAVIPPQAPTRPATSSYTYEFIGWDKEVVACIDHAVYVAQYAETAVQLEFDLTDGVTSTDVIYLLWHTMFPGSYPIDENVDFTQDGQINNEDVIYLLWHTMFPENYPI